MAGASAAGAAPSLFKVLIQRRSVALGLAILAVVVFAAVFADLIAPHDPGVMSVRNRLKPPGAEWWFGTDEFGRDVFTRLIYAGRVSLIVGIGTAVLASVIGIILGLTGGFFRKLDAPVSRLVDAMMAFPDILLAISLVAVLGGSLSNLILALSIVYAPRVARVVRAATLVIRELPYVEAARALGTSTWRILVHHILRNMVSPVIVQATFIFAYSMLAEAGLSFLGVGVDPSTPTWGSMINGGRQYIGTADWLILFPGLAITLSVLSLQIAGDGLRDALDPRLSKDL
ncbi:ABC transporter permease subunit [Microvirga tunisiensis]|uniref:ABC transporter permease subunit n=2 Tax=Pannonibacter tanglangensis TaxID=2750084 RepID=A0A7X5J9Q5_9HYPH|nr:MULTISPECIES: ABC transporter permease [unclassified Pannonibacter]NBN64202.1 ABC transporter permease subunit [Pannonibacter sp. XCT-34]NBN78736.1 ABC transporter permease subunit [Pannonibacter sp. XCT-53]